MNICPKCKYCKSPGKEYSVCLRNYYEVREYTNVVTGAHRPAYKEYRFCSSIREDHPNECPDYEERPPEPEEPKEEKKSFWQQVLEYL